MKTVVDLDALTKSIVAEHRKTTQQMIDRGMITYQHYVDALEYAISILQKDIDSEVY